MKLYIATISIMLIIGTINVIQVYGTSSNRGINWEDMCRLADAVISEPCNDLVNSNNPYQLTKEGERVIACIGGGALALATGNFALLNLAPAVGCGGSSHSDLASNTNPLDNLLSNLFGN